MTSSLVLSLLLGTALLGAAQDGPLEIANARATYGYLGARYNTKEGRLPGDTAHFSFDVRNLKLDDKGRASYSMLVEILDDKGRPHFKLGPINSVAQNYLGGNSMPCSGRLDIPADTPPGNYLFRVTVTEGVDVGQSADAERDELSIGTDEGNDLRLTDTKVSRHHCTISPTEEGFELRDLGSRNGTLIAECAIRSAYLKPGVSLRIGNSRILFDVLTDEETVAKLVGALEALVAAEISAAA